MKRQTANKKQSTDIEKLVPPDDIGDLLNITGRSVCNHFHAGILPGYRIGKSIRFSVSEVIEAIKKEGKP